MPSLAPKLRKDLENAVKRARRVAEVGAVKALEQLAVGHHEPWGSMKDPAQRRLRNRLRAHGQQLGDVRDAQRGTQSITRLKGEVAYEHWHRMLFARYLAENDLLIEPESGQAMTMDECRELAREQGKDWLPLACGFAQQMLPEIFRQGDPVLEVALPPETRSELEDVLNDLPREVFVASDSLGWVYQFWQADQKEAVNKSENKIGADELPAVTQLFTEDYMVDFLLDNTLGAWWAGKVLAANPPLAENAQSEAELRESCALHGCSWTYLRFIRDSAGQSKIEIPESKIPWAPAAGSFPGWPKRAKELSCLDPCMGSGHFVVAMFERLVALRIAEEGLDEKAAVSAVIRDNLFGLELDPRCTQIAAFNLALAAWRRVGHCALPPMHLACSGLAPNARESDWLKLAGESDKLQRGMARLYRLFQNGPVLGSLINPRTGGEGNLIEAGFQELHPLLAKALAQESSDDAALEMAVTAQGIAKAAEILAGQFTLVATNVPYLGRGNQEKILLDYCERVHPEGSADLATCFVERCHAFARDGGSAALVTPQSWLFLAAYKKLRKRLLNDTEWNAVARLGAHAFETIGGEVVNVSLIVHSCRTPTVTQSFIGLDVADDDSPVAKAKSLLGAVGSLTSQRQQLNNPDWIIQLGADSGLTRVKESEHVSAMELRNTAFTKPGLYAAEKVRWPEILGSDTHNFVASGDPRFPGSHYTWVKMDRPSLAALKLALHDGNAFSLKRSDVCASGYNPNAAPQLWIESLSVSRARLMGNGAKAEFKLNPWMNAIIGGRGSGKSTLVHFLRLVTKRDADLNLAEGQPDNRVKVTFDSFAQVGSDSRPGGLRAETVAEAVIRKGDQRFLLQWKQDGRAVTVSEWDAAAQAWKPASSQDVVDRFPVRLFSQDEIGVIVERPEALLRRVDESIAKADWTARYTASENQFVELLSKVRSLRTRLAEKDRLVGQRDDLAKQLAAFAQSEHAKIRQAFQKASRQKQASGALFEEFRDLATRVGTLKDELSLSDLPPGLLDPADPIDQELQKADTQLRQNLAKTVSALGQMETDMRSQADAAESALAQSSWNTAATIAEQEHETLMTSLKAQGVTDPAAYANLLVRRQEVEKQLKEIEGTEAEINRLTTQASESLGKLLELRAELRALREAFLKQELQGNRFVRISLVPFGHEGGKNQIEAEIRRDLQCQDTRFSSAIRSREDGNGFVEKLYAALPADAAGRTKELLKRIQDWKQQVFKAAKGEVNDLGGHFSNHLSAKFKDRPEALDRFRMWWPEDALVVSYSRAGDGDNFVNLSSGGSAGEKAAALLAFFLAHGNTPLIIDQPENDLDNHLITDLVVAQLQNNKERRQIIVVTHNPNIVVNGDAELVHAMEFGIGQCRAKVSGALQDEAVRTEVCAVMEGGKTALKSRYERLI